MEETSNIGFVLAQFQKVSEVSGRNDKIRLLEEAMDYSPTAKEIVRQFYLYIWDPWKRFHIHISQKDVDQYPAPTIIADNEVLDAAFSVFLTFLDNCADKSHRGKDAKIKAASFIAMQPKEFQKWYLCILNKSMTIGINSGTFEKFFPDQIKYLFVQNCLEWDLSDITEPRYLETKVDGIRGWIILDGDECQAISRNGHELNNCQHIITELRACGLDQVVVDVELISKTWDKTMTAVRSSENGNQDSQAILFDLLPLSKARSTEEVTTPLSLRRKALVDVVSPTSKCLKVVPHGIVNSKDELFWLTLDFLSLGFEGSVMKDPSSTYKYERNTDWQKIKVRQMAELAVELGDTHVEAMKSVLSRVGRVWPEMDVEIVEVCEGRGHFIGTCGALTIEHNGIRTNVGSGLLKDIRMAEIRGRHPTSSREWIWKNRETVIGMKCTILFDEISKDGRFRFPIFHRMRQDL